MNNRIKKICKGHNSVQMHPAPTWAKLSHAKDEDKVWVSETSEQLQLQLHTPHTPKKRSSMK